MSQASEQTLTEALSSLPSEDWHQRFVELVVVDWGYDPETVCIRSLKVLDGLDAVGFLVTNDNKYGLAACTTKEVKEAADAIMSALRPAEEWAGCMCALKSSNGRLAVLARRIKGSTYHALWSALSDYGIGHFEIRAATEPK
jgi:hypothetical protein